jgi:ABC-2 type transport system permease protein
MPIFDQGYQHWSGKLSGHAWRWWTISVTGFIQGIRGGGVARTFFRLLIIASWFPAAILAFMLCAWGLLEQKSSLVTPLMPILAFFFPPEMLANPKDFRTDVWTLCYHYFLQFELYVSMVVVLFIGPSLISLDLRFNALPLYLSRPLRRIDYFAGKLGVIAAFLGLVIIVPSLIAYVLGLLFSMDLTIIADTWTVLVGSLEYGVIIVLSAGTLILALSSLSRNSRFIALFWVALWFVSSLVGGILEVVEVAQRENKAQVKFMEANRVQQPIAPPPMDRPMTPEERRDWGEKQLAQQNAWKKIQEELQEEELQAAKTDWRPLVSYTANLSRMGHLLLGTDNTWKKLAGLKPEQERTAFLVEYQGPQYPWYWSAAVLAVLFGLSACILNFRVRSLDRLK